MLSSECNSPFDIHTLCNFALYKRFAQNFDKSAHHNERIIISWMLEWRKVQHTNLKFPSLKAARIETQVGHKSTILQHLRKYRELEESRTGAMNLPLLNFRFPRAQNQRKLYKISIRFTTKRWPFYGYTKRFVCESNTAHLSILNTPFTLSHCIFPS